MAWVFFGSVSSKRLSQAIDILHPFQTRTAASASEFGGADIESKGAVDGRVSAAEAAKERNEGIRTPALAQTLEHNIVVGNVDVSRCSIMKHHLGGPRSHFGPARNMRWYYGLTSPLPGWTWNGQRSRFVAPSIRRAPVST